MYFTLWKGNIVGITFRICCFCNPCQLKTNFLVAALPYVNVGYAWCLCWQKERCYIIAYCKWFVIPFKKKFKNLSEPLNHFYVAKHIKLSDCLIHCLYIISWYILNNCFNPRDTFIGVRLIEYNGAYIWGLGLFS